MGACLAANCVARTQKNGVAGADSARRTVYRADALGCPRDERRPSSFGIDMITGGFSNVFSETGASKGACRGTPLFADTRGHIKIEGVK